MAYGSQAVGVAIFKTNGAEVEVRTAVAKEGAPIDSQELKQGKEKNVYLNKDGSAGSVRITPSEVEGVTNLVFKSPGGDLGGIGIADGNYLAVGMAPGTKDFGVALYHLGKGPNALGKWVVAGAPGTGTEELTILTVDGEKVSAAASKTESAPQSAGAGDDKNAG